MAAEAKTKPTRISPTNFLKAIEDDERRKDCLEILKMMKTVTGEQPVVWNGNMIGFGKYHYKYESGHEGDCFITGFSPRKQNLTLYVLSGFNRQPEIMDNLGKFKTGKSCLYIKKLSDVDKGLLRELIAGSYLYMKKKHKQ